MCFTPLAYINDSNLSLVNPIALSDTTSGEPNNFHNSSTVAAVEIADVMYRE